MKKSVKGITPASTHTKLDTKQKKNKQKRIAWGEKHGK